MQKDLSAALRALAFTFVFAQMLPATAQVATKDAADAVYPSKPIRVVVAYTPGSAIDVIARTLGPVLSEGLQQQMVIDNRPGAGGIIGTDIVAKAAPTGYTLLVTSTSLVIMPNAYKNLPFDLSRDLEPITMVASVPMVVIVNAAFPVNTIKELIAYARANPGQLRFASGGRGTGPHLAAEMLKSMAHIQMDHIPYKGGAPATAAVLGGEVSMFFTTTVASLPLIKQGKVKVLAVTVLKRTQFLPEVPTLDEAGVPGFEYRVWYGYFAPAKTPKPIVQRVHAELAKALQTSVIKSRFAGVGMEPVGMGPEEFGRVFQAELRKWAKFVRDAGLNLY